MGLVENHSGQEGHGNGFKIVAFLVLLVVVLGTAGLAYLNSQDVDLKTISLRDLLDRNFFTRSSVYEVSSTEYEYDSNLSTAFGAHKGYIVKCTRDSLIYIDANGNEQWSFPMSLNNPVLKSAGSFLLVADYGAKTFYVFSDKNLEWEKELDNKIINAEISPKGYVTVVHEDERSRGAVTVYNRQGMKCFTVGRAKNFILSSKVSDSGKSGFYKHALKHRELVPILYWNFLI